MWSPSRWTLVLAPPSLSCTSLSVLHLHIQHQWSELMMGRWDRTGGDGVDSPPTRGSAEDKTSWHWTPNHLNHLSYYTPPPPPPPPQACQGAGSSPLLLTDLLTCPSSPFSLSPARLLVLPATPHPRQKELRDAPPLTLLRPGAQRPPLTPPHARTRTQKVLHGAAGLRSAREQ